MSKDTHVGGAHTLLLCLHTACVHSHELCTHKGCMLTPSTHAWTSDTDANTLWLVVGMIPAPATWVGFFLSMFRTLLN